MASKLKFKVGDLVCPYYRQGTICCISRIEKRAPYIVVYHVKVLKDAYPYRHGLYYTPITQYEARALRKVEETAEIMADIIPYYILSGQINNGQEI